MATGWSFSSWLAHAAAACSASDTSGNVTGPDSRLSSPNTTGEPLAGWAVPRFAVVDALCVPAGDDAGLLAPLLPLPPLLEHAAAIRPHAASAAATATGRALPRFTAIGISLWWCMCFIHPGPARRPGPGRRGSRP